MGRTRLPSARGIAVRQATGRAVAALGVEPGPIEPPVASDCRQVLTLDGFPTPGQVRMLGPNSGTSNRFALNTLRQHVQARVGVEVRLQGIRPVPPPVQVTLRYVFADARARDDGNFSLVAKPVLDGLVRAGILQGDDHARLTERVEFAKEPGARRLEVILEGP